MFKVCELSLFPVYFRVLLHPINFSSCFSSLKNPFFSPHTFHPYLCLHPPIVPSVIKYGVKKPTNNKTTSKLQHHNNNKSHNFTKETEVFLIEALFCTLQMTSASPGEQNVRRKNGAGCCGLNRSQWNGWGGLRRKFEVKKEDNNVFGMSGWRKKCIHMGK